MAIEKLELVDIACYIEDLNNVLQRCYNSECFHIEPPGQNSDEKFIALNEENPYSEPLEKLEMFFSQMKFVPHETDFSKLEPDSADELRTYISECETELLDINNRVKSLSENISLREQVSSQLSHLEGIDTDYQKIFSCNSISVRFGKLPVDSYQKLAYHSDKPFIFNTYDNDGEYYWGMYFAPCGLKNSIDSMFKGLYFERIRLPEFVEGTGKDARLNNEKALENARTELKDLNERRIALLKEKKNDFNMVYSKLLHYSGIFSLRRNAAVYNDKYVVATGYIPEKKAKSFSAMFKELETVSLVIRPCVFDGHNNPPTKLKNNWFSEPFSMFVEMYGLPACNGFDPTMLVAVTYTLLFGLMFADLGQGIVLSIFGALLWKFKKNRLGAILARVGVASALFGFIFGSVFGYEHMLDPVFNTMGFAEKPFEVMNNILPILYGAIGLGVVFVIFTILLNIFVGIKQKNYERALFSNNGLSGLVFFVAIVGALLDGILFKIGFVTPLYIVGLIVLPALLMFFREPLGCLISHRKPEHVSVGDFIASNFFEVFEFGLSFATNTLAFVRVGGFILSHAGMMSVVMLLADGKNPVVSIIIVVVGNIFVMGMEGLIVGIQSLRLEFYEIFSRFYDGDGYAFEPVNLKVQTEKN